MIFTSDPNLQIVRNGLNFWYDALFQTSYPYSGTTIYDISGAGNNGTLVNSPIYAGTYGGGINFSPIGSQYGTLPTPLIPATADWTWSCYFSENILTPGAVLYCQYVNAVGNGRFIIEFEATAGANQNKLNLRLLSGSGYPSTVIYSTLIPTAGQAYSATITRTTNTYDIYIDGVLDVTSTTAFTANLLQTTPVIAGRSAGATPTPATTGFLDGIIYSMYIYNRALSAAEVAHNYKVTKGRFT